MTQLVVRLAAYDHFATMNQVSASLFVPPAARVNAPTGISGDFDATALTQNCMSASAYFSVPTATMPPTLVIPGQTTNDISNLMFYIVNCWCRS